MSRKKGLTRRQFLERTAVATTAMNLIPGSEGAAQAPPSDRIGAALIGAGIRGIGLLQSMQDIPGLEVRAVADLYDGHLQRAKELTQNRAETMRDYRSLLPRRDIDAVVIATPDHWHKPQVIEALEASKDVYCEKPLTWKPEEGAEIAAAVKRTGRLLQVGSQWRSIALNEKARELIRSGALGKITMIKGWEHRNTPMGAWVYPIPPDASSETLNWEQFLGPAPKSPFSLERFFRWRCWWDYSGGVATDLFVHYLTAIHWITGATMPRTALSTGGLYRWKDGRDVPDQLTTLYDYGDFTVNLYVNLNSTQGSSGIIFLGTEGSLDYSPRRIVFTPDKPRDSFRYALNCWPQGLAQAWSKEQKLGRDLVRWEPAQCESGQQIFEAYGEDSTVAHLRAFFQSVRSRQPTVEDAEMGNHACLAAHMANFSYRNKKVAAWDAARGRIV